MHYTFEELKNDFESKLAEMVITKSGIGSVCDRLIAIKQRYLDVQALNGVPAAWLMAVDYREGDNDIHTLFANGDPLNRVSTHVPAGLGPFTGNNAWQRGCIISLEHDHIDKVPQPWDAARAAFEANAWNGFGPNNHGKDSGYVWAGTNIYRGGGYPSDGKWDPNYQDHRFGVASLLYELGRRDPALALIGWSTSKPTGDLPATPQPAPDKVSDTKAIQARLNDLGYGPLVVDGSFGSKTRMAVRAFQKASDLTQDGIVGPNTRLAMSGAKAPGKPAGGPKAKDTAQVPAGPKNAPATISVGFWSRLGKRLSELIHRKGH